MVYHREEGYRIYVQWLSLFIASKILISIMVCLSFSWLSLTVSSYFFPLYPRGYNFKWNKKFSFPFFPKIWLLRKGCWANFELLWFLKYKRCSLNLFVKFLPLWPKKLLLQSKPLCWFTPKQGIYRHCKNIFYNISLYGFLSFVRYLQTGVSKIF